MSCIGCGARRGFEVRWLDDVGVTAAACRGLWFIAPRVEAWWVSMPTSMQVNKAFKRSWMGLWQPITMARILWLRPIRLKIQRVNALDFEARRLIFWFAGTSEGLLWSSGRALAF